MDGPISGIKRFLFWDYPRAGWQYDVMVGLILAFIFITPREWFRDQPRANSIVMLPAERGATEFLAPGAHREEIPRSPFGTNCRFRTGDQGFHGVHNAIIAERSKESLSLHATASKSFSCMYVPGRDDRAGRASQAESAGSCVPDEQSVE